MATRSVVAIPAGDGWQGRYVHWDGHPDSRVPVLLNLIMRDGLGKVADTIVGDNHGWSHLDHDHYGDLADGYQDGRFISRPGYGVAYTKDQAGDGAILTDQTADPVWIEYAYILGPKSLTVIESDTADGSHAWRTIESIRYEDAPSRLSQMAEVV